MAKIEVTKGTLVGLCAALGACVLVLAFLLGRASVQMPKAPAASEALAVQSLPSMPPTSAPPPPLLLPSSPSPALVIAHPSQATAVRPAPMPPSPTAPDPVRAEVAAYFQALDRIQPGQMSGDPESMAQGLLDTISKGDTSGFDGMVRQAESARAALAALVPPAPCTAFHQKSLASLDDSLALLRSFRNSLTGSATSLDDLAFKATGIQSRAQALQREEKALKQRYGVGE